ncbi:MAG: hydrogenase maturation nickel metallochaperone HypA [Deinococcus sp.]|nr:hydrogenase maturation nickel metallochaperone HypA [Deinococcus sp.]
MHESSLMAGLLQRIESIAREHGASRVVAVTVQLGALAQVSPDHFREHFVRSASGTVADGARLDIQVLSDVRDPQAQAIVLAGVELSDDGCDSEG